MESAKSGWVQILVEGPLPTHKSAKSFAFFFGKMRIIMPAS